MTNKDVARLEGEIFGLKVLMANCLSFIARYSRDGSAELDAIQSLSVAGIADASVANVLPQYQRHAQEAAAGLVLQMVEVAKDSIDPTSPRLNLQ